MCVVFLAYKIHPDFPLILLANRDEFYNRPTQKAEYWKDYPNILAGRDLVGGGTWLGVTKSGRFAAVTNYRDPSAPNGIRSRGNLTADFLKSNESANNYLTEILEKADHFSGFNLLVGEINSTNYEICYFSNRSTEIVKLSPGIYGLSNHLLDTAWHKVETGKEAFADLINEKTFTNESFFKLLNDRTIAIDERLPDTGIGYELEKKLSPIFIETPIYGTRCSTVLTIDNDFKINFEEKVYV